MSEKKLLVMLTLLSFTGHGLFIGLAGISERGGRTYPIETFTVQLVADVTAKRQRPTPASPSLHSTSDPASPHRQAAEKTVSLSSHQAGEYEPYLIQVKRRIKQAWLYPPEVTEANIMGIAVVRFTIKNTGDLIHSSLERSSGYESLDQNALAAIKAAAPFPPLPAALSKLHIVASFNFH